MMRICLAFIALTLAQGASAQDFETRFNAANAGIHLPLSLNRTAVLRPFAIKTIVAPIDATGRPIDKAGHAICDEASTDGINEVDCFDTIAVVPWSVKAQVTVRFYKPTSRVRIEEDTVDMVIDRANDEYDAMLFFTKTTNRDEKIPDLAEKDTDSSD